MFNYGEACATLTVEGDSDHAGCIRTRKSTSGGVIRWGCHVLKWWSKTQPTLALSSGEAELAAIVRSTSEGLGMQAIMEEYGIKVDLVVKSDAVAAIGIVKRQGLGRVRHLAVADLWVQQKAKEAEVTYKKLEGKRNTSDMLTKAVDHETLSRHMQSLGMVYREGRNENTPAYNGREDGTPEGKELDEEEEVENVRHRASGPGGTGKVCSTPEPKVKPSIARTTSALEPTRIKNT